MQITLMCNYEIKHSKGVTANETGVIKTTRQGRFPIDMSPYLLISTVKARKLRRN
jgi:hypothetical protein